MKRLALAGAALWVLVGSSLAQQPIVQSGPVTPGHPLMVITNGVAGDGGTAAQGKLTGIGTTGQGPTICANSGPVTGPYNRLCLSTTQTGGGSLNLDNLGGATGGISINVNGTPQPFSVPPFISPPHQFLTSFTAGAFSSAQPTFADISGLGTMAQQNANAVAITGGTITGLPAPQANNDAATKQYVDLNATGLHLHTPVVLATTAPLAAYNWTATGGGTLTGQSNGLLSIDSTAVSAAQRVLVKDELNSGTACNGNVNAACDGIYIVSVIGDGSNPYKLVRSSTLDSQGFAENTAQGWNGGDTVAVSGGSTNVSSVWANTVDIITINQTAFGFFEFSTGVSQPWQINGSSVYYSGGNVGVGTSTPANPLSVVGNISATGNVSGVNGTFSGPVSGTALSGTNLALSGNVTSGGWAGTAIPNNKLANSSTTVNGTPCTLGSTCSPPGPPAAGGRLVAASPNCTSAPNIQLANVPTAPVVCYVPYLPGVGNQIWVNGANLTFTTQTLTLDATHHLVGNLYDIFEIAGPAICAGGNPWSAPTISPARTDAVHRLSNGLGANTGTITHCWNNSVDLGPIAADAGTYLGTCYMISNGNTVWLPSPTPVATGSPAYLGCYNAYNQVPTFAFEGEGATTNINYAAGTTSGGKTVWRNWGSTGATDQNNRIYWVDGSFGTPNLVNIKFNISGDGQNSGVNGGTLSTCMDGNGGTVGGVPQFTCPNGSPLDWGNSAGTALTWSMANQLAGTGIATTTLQWYHERWFAMIGLHFAQQVIAIFSGSVTFTNNVGSPVNNASWTVSTVQLPM